MLRYKNNHLNFRSGRPLICLILMLLTPLILWGQIVVTNPGFGYDELEDEIPRQNTRFTNSGDFDLTYTISDELVGFENGERQGPERDDLGDLIDQFQPPQVGVGGRYVTGLAWDWNNSWMWLSESDNPLIVAVDPANNYQEAARFNGPGGGRDGASGAGWYADVLYLVGWVNQPFVYSYDTEGNNLGNINAGFSVGAVTCSQENGWLMIMGSNRDILVLDIENDYQEIGRFNDYQQFLQGQLAQSMCWVDLHRDGQLWINTRDDEGGGADVAWQIAVDTEEWECIDLIQSYVSDQQQMGHPRDGIGHDGVNLWLANWSEPNIRIVDDGNAELRMLLYEPVEGGLEPGEELELNYVIDFEGADPGTYHFLMEFRFENQDAGYAEVVQMSAVLSNNVPTAALSGQILDEGTGDPIEGALVELDRYEISRLTDENGEFSIVDLPLGAYELTITTPDYLQLTHQLDLEEGVNEVNLGLLQAIFEPSLEDVSRDLAPNENTRVEFTGANEGNGPLNFVVDRRLLGEANTDPWDLRNSHYFGEDVADTRLMGAIFANNRFYVAGAGEANPVVYVFSREGELLSQFDQPEGGRYGMRDLAWDGQLIWGSGTNRIFALTTDGEVIHNIAAPEATTNNVAWDPDRERLWVSGTTTDIYGVTVEGEEVQELSRQGLRIYGLAYWSDDPDGHQLYLFHRILDVGELLVAKMNIENGELLDVANLTHEFGGTAQGAFVTNQFDIYSWVFVTLANVPADDGGDRVDIWQIEGRKDWMQIEPNAGVLDPGAEMNFLLTLDATDLPAEVFEGELVFVHDGLGGETHIAVTLNVTDGPAQGELTIELTRGWNMVSAYVQPEDPDIRALTRELVERESLLLMKNSVGQFYNPEFNFCNIPGWNVAEGYLMKMADEDEFTLTGMTVAADEAIELDLGWQIVSYYPRSPIEARQALSGIVDNLLLAKDGSGRFYNPAFDFSNMGDLRPGQGYLLKMAEADELVYQAGEERGVNLFAGTTNPQPEHFRSVPVTGEDLSLLVRSSGARTGEVAVFAGETLVGSGVIYNGSCGLAIRGDDTTTKQLDGALSGQELTIKIWDGTVELTPEVQVLAGELTYSPNSFTAISLPEVNSLPTEFSLESIYPNPFNSMATITYTIPEASAVALEIYNINGRLVETLVDRAMPAGRHNVVWEANTAPAGVYLARMSDGKGGIKGLQKIVLMK